MVDTRTDISELRLNFSGPGESAPGRAPDRAEEDAAAAGARSIAEVPQPPLEPCGYEHFGAYRVLAGHGIWRLNERAEWLQLTNWTAKIVRQTVLRDDAHGCQRRFYAVEASTVADPRAVVRFELADDEFEAKRWWSRHLGSHAVVSPGNGAAEHARLAIREWSGLPPSGSTYDSTGWHRAADGRPIFVHRGGALGAAGPLSPDEAKLDEAHTLDVRLEAPPDAAALPDAVRRTLATWDMASDRVTIALDAACWRSVIGVPADFSVHVSGTTGSLKSSLAAVFQQRFGRALTAHKLQSWSSTENALEAVAYKAKDILLVVDDFKPCEGMAPDKLHAKAERLLRSAGNQAGRSRMRSDTTLRRGMYPRGIIASTGEDTPRGRSLRARFVDLHHTRETVSQEVLTACQHDASSGVHGQVLAAFVQWLARDLEGARRSLQERVEKFRPDVPSEGLHLRTPQIIANLEAAMSLFLDFVEETGALTAAEVVDRRARAREALHDLARAQVAEQKGDNPVTRFFELLRAAISLGSAYIGNKTNRPDGEWLQVWGYKQNGFGTKASWSRPDKADCLGYLFVDPDGIEHLYLEPHTTFANARRLAQQTGSPFDLTARMLHKALRDEGHLMSTGHQAGRQSIAVQKQLPGLPRTNYLDVRPDSFQGEERAPERSHMVVETAEPSFQPCADARPVGSIARAEEDDALEAVAAMLADISPDWGSAASDQ